MQWGQTLFIMYFNIRENQPIRLTGAIKDPLPTDIFTENTSPCFIYLDHSCHACICANIQQTPKQNRTQVSEGIPPFILMCPGTEIIYEAILQMPLASEVQQVELRQ